MLIFMQVQCGQPLKTLKTVEISTLAESLSVVLMILPSNVTQYLVAPFQLWDTSIHLGKTTAKMSIFLQVLVFTELFLQVAAVTLAHWRRQQLLLLLLLLLLMQAIGVTFMDSCFCSFHLSCCFSWVLCSTYVLISYDHCKLLYPFSFLFLFSTLLLSFCTIIISKIQVD